MLPFVLAVPATQTFFTGLAGATVATTPFLPVTDSQGNRVPLYALLVMKPNGGTLTQQLLDYSNILQKVGIATLATALRELEKVGVIDWGGISNDNDIGIPAVPINPSGIDLGTVSLFDNITHIVPASAVVAPIPRSGNVSDIPALPSFLPIPKAEVIPQNPSIPSDNTNIGNPAVPDNPALPNEGTIPNEGIGAGSNPVVIPPYEVPQFPIYQGVLCELISQILTELRQFVINEARNMASKMDEYLRNYYSAVSICRSITETEYGFERCFDDKARPYMNAYNDVYYKSVALNQAYISLSADLIRSLLRQCLKPDIIWSCLGGISQDMFNSKEEFLESANWEREQMVQNEPCCLKRLCCYGVK
ncbi:MAG: hypothetical protein PHC64_09365 [Candidatus Gastranaerophilales bacterium]|nr:hypothetical protein [Candidatus Gastranaerophilales bacterium]